MKTYYASGTVGDAYVILCKLYSVAKKENIICRHQVAYENLKPTIKEIYALLPNINVEFREKENYKTIICGNFYKEHIEAEKKLYNLEITYHPEFELADINHFNLPESYVTLQIKAGTHTQNNQNLSVDVIKEILNHVELPMVIIGEKSIDLPMGKFNVLDLREKTTIKEVINIIKNSEHFYGLLGFLSFVAASHKIMSDLWIKSRSNILAARVRQEAVEQWRKFLIKRK